MSGQASYDVYVKGGVDPMGRDKFGEAVAHFVERGNAVALKRRLVARGETVHVVRNVVHGLTEAEKKRPVFGLPSDTGVQRPLRTQARAVRFVRWVLTQRRLRERIPQDRGGKGGWVHEHRRSQAKVAMGWHLPRVDQECT